MFLLKLEFKNAFIKSICSIFRFSIVTKVSRIRQINSIKVVI